MKDEDYKLSMRIAPRGKIPSDGLRQLLVNRLSDTYKAVFRRPLRSGAHLSCFCEECSTWTRHVDFALEWTCPRCSTSYRIEFAVYEEVEKRHEP